MEADNGAYLQKRESLLKRHKGLAQEAPGVDSIGKYTYTIPAYAPVSQFEEEVLLLGIPTLTYEQWKAIPTDANPGYTKHESNGTIEYTWGDEAKFMLMLRQKAAYVLDYFRPFVWPHSKAYLQRPVSENSREEVSAAAGYTLYRSASIHFFAHKMLKYSDMAVYDVVLHEVAHLVHGKRFMQHLTVSKELESHGRDWRLIFTRMGGSGEEKMTDIRLMHPFRSDVENPDNFVMICTNNGPDGRCCRACPVSPTSPLTSADNHTKLTDILKSVGLRSDGKLIFRAGLCMWHHKPFQLIVPDYFKLEGEVNEKKRMWAYFISIMKRRIVVAPPSQPASS